MLLNGLTLAIVISLVICIVYVSVLLGTSFFRLFKDPLPAFVANSPELNKKILLDHVRKAKKEVIILCGNLRPQIYDKEIAVAMADAIIERNVLFRIVCAHPIDENSNAVWRLLYDERFDNRFEIYLHDGAPSFGHFRVRDRKYYTVEKSVRDRDRKSATRDISKNTLTDAMSVAYLLSFFEEIWFQAHSARPQLSMSDPS